MSIDGVVISDIVKLIKERRECNSWSSNALCVIVYGPVERYMKCMFSSIVKGLKFQWPSLQVLKSFTLCLEVENNQEKETNSWVNSNKHSKEAREDMEVKRGYEFSYNDIVTFRSVNQSSASQSVTFKKKTMIILHDLPSIWKLSTYHDHQHLFKVMLQLFLRDPTNVLLISAEHAQSVPYFITQITTPITYKMPIFTPSSAVRLMRMLKTDIPISHIINNKGVSKFANYKFTPEEFSETMQPVSEHHSTEKRHINKYLEEIVYAALARIPSTNITPSSLTLSLCTLLQLLSEREQEYWSLYNKKEKQGPQLNFTDNKKNCECYVVQPYQEEYEEEEEEEEELSYIYDEEHGVQYMTSKLQWMDELQQNRQLTSYSTNSSESHNNNNNNNNYSNNQNDERRQSCQQSTLYGLDDIYKRIKLMLEILMYKVENSDSANYTTYDEEQQHRENECSAENVDEKLHEGNTNSTNDNNDSYSINENDHKRASREFSNSAVENKTHTRSLISSLPCTSGILLHGPSGCGKSALTRKLACDFAHIYFIFVECTQLFSKYLGESEARLRQIYRQARMHIPAVVVLDNVETIAMTRGAMQEGSEGNGSAGSGEGGVNVHRRLLAGLLCELDGVNENKGVLTIACTTAPELLDAALLRQGRLETMMYISALSYQSAYDMTNAFFTTFAECTKTCVDANVNSANNDDNNNNASDDTWHNIENEQSQEKLPHEHAKVLTAMVAEHAEHCTPVALQFILRKILEMHLSALEELGESVLDGVPLPSLELVDRVLFIYAANLTKMPTRFN